MSGPGIGQNGTGETTLFNQIAGEPAANSRCWRSAAP